MSKKKDFPMNIGMSSILLIFVVLCLASFGILSIAVPLLIQQGCKKPVHGREKHFCEPHCTGYDKGYAYLRYDGGGCRDGVCGLS